MNDSTIAQISAEETPTAGQPADQPHASVQVATQHGKLVEAAPSLEPEIPQFGAIDIVEAFTAMRHEWRGQIKESRLLAEQIQTTVENIQALETQLLDFAQAQTDKLAVDDDADTRPLVLLVIETDLQLSRAVSAVAQWEANERSRTAVDAQVVERYFAGMNVLARWFARPLFTFITAQHADRNSTSGNPAIEGLNLVLARLRRVMNEHEIERLETLGEEFDADIMRAIGTVTSSEFPAGNVAEQYSPAYRWRGRLLRYAEVRVAQ